MELIEFSKYHLFVINFNFSLQRRILFTFRSSCDKNIQTLTLETYTKIDVLTQKEKQFLHLDDIKKVHAQKTSKKEKYAHFL